MLKVEDIENKIINADCLDILKQLPDKCVDMILCDLPYGTTACKWDSVISFNKLWENYNRIIKKNCAIVLTSSQPFTTDLINSNRKNFKYSWVWNKHKAGNIMLAKFQPMKIHEDILIFGNGSVNYYPIKTPRMTIKKSKNYKTGDVMGAINKNENKIYQYEDKFPESIIDISNAKQEGLHPTQKPVKLFEYLIKTYSKENDLVLDNCSGSGTTAIACRNLNRRFICIEKDKEYWEKSVECLQIAQAQQRLNLKF